MTEQRDPRCRPDCGACCSPVVLPFSKLEVEASAAQLDAVTLRWVREDLTPMPHAEAREKAPYLYDRHLAATPDGPGEILLSPNVFRCANFDPDTKLCRIWDDRPDVCRDYPLYGRSMVHPNAAIPSTCGYLVTSVAAPVRRGKIKARRR